MALDLEQNDGNADQATAHKDEAERPTLVPTLHGDGPPLTEAAGAPRGLHKKPPERRTTSFQNDSAAKTTPADRHEKSAPPKGFLRQHRMAVWIGIPVLIVAVAGSLLYWDNSRHFESTDDAFIAARQYSVAPKVSGYITAVPVTDNQHVRVGDVIARIDPRDYRIALDQARAQVAAAEANVRNIDAQVEVQQSQIQASQAQVEQAKANLTFAQQQATRYQELAKTGSGTIQNEQQYSYR